MLWTKTLKASAARWRHLVTLVFHLAATGQFDMLRAAFRRRFMKRFMPLMPVEYIKDEFRDDIVEKIDTIACDLDDDDTYCEINDIRWSDDTRPLVSVIIPCFNYGSSVHKAIDSVLVQTLGCVEIIVVEGGSTDGVTAEIVRNIDRPRTRVIMQDRPTLVGANRNTGISAARGLYICCLDADDTIDPTYLEKAVYLLETHRYDVVSTGMRFVGARIGTMDVIGNPTLKDMTTGNHVSTCGVFSRYLWEVAGGFVDTGKGVDHVAEDWDFWVRVSATGARIRNITGEHLFNYTIHPGGSLSSAAGVQSRAKQGAIIMARNRPLLSPEALSKSTAESRRRITLTRPGGRLLQTSWQGIAGRRLLIAVPYLIVGGAERLLSTVVRLLVAKGWSVTVISTLPQEGHDDASAWFRDSTYEIYMLPRFLNDWEHDGFIKYLIESRRFDALLLAGSRRVYELLPEIGKNYPDIAVIDLLFNIVGHTQSHLQYQKYIDMVIAENREVSDWANWTGRSERKIRLIESGIDAHKFETERPSELARKLDIADDDIVIGFSGRFSSEKAPEIFVQIAELMKNEGGVCFVMTGNGPMRSALEAKVHSLPPDARFKFLGLVDDPAPYFALYDIFVLPSRLDGRPMALLEALSAGCAIVASRVGGIPAVLDGTGAGILCPAGDSRAFVKAIRQLISDRPRLREMKRAAAESARRVLSEDRMAAGYAEAIEAAIGINRMDRDAL